MTENKRQYVDRNMKITKENDKEENKIKLIGEKMQK
jgi:hypothetical protein